MDNDLIRTVLIQAGIPLVAGVFGTLLGYRIVGKPPGIDPRYDAWHKRFGNYLKVVGPLLIVLSIGIAIFNITMAVGRAN